MKPRRSPWPEWDALRAMLPAPFRALPLRDLGVPAQVDTYAAREGLVTLGDLAARSAAELMAAPHLGRLSIHRMCQVVRAHLTAAGAALEVPAPPKAPKARGRAPKRGAGDEAGRRARVLSSLAAAHVEERRRLTDTGLLESWKTLVEGLSPEHRMAIERRAGLGGRKEYLGEIGASMGRSRERARVLEAQALAALRREEVWLGEIKRRANAVLEAGEGAAALDELAADPWWSAIARLPDALDYLGERLLGGKVRVVTLRGRPHLARCSERELDRALSELKSRVEQAVPAPLATIRALVAPLEKRLGRVPAEAMFEELARSFRVDDVPGTEPRLVGVGTGQEAMVAILRASPSPLRFDELRARVGLGRGDLPDGMVRLGHNTVGLLQHIPDVAAWTARLVPPAIRVMKEAGAERQWTAEEICEAIGEEVLLPAWLDAWRVTAMLRTTAELRYLGRRRFVLAGASPGDEERIHYHDEICRVVRMRGAPMTRGEISSELVWKTSVSEATLSMCLTLPPILRCGPDLYGLRDRDLPGGAEALAAAVERVLALLAERGQGAGASELHVAVAPLSAPHARWTPEMCVSALRGNARFRFEKSRRAAVVGLASWPTSVGPTRVALVRLCLSEGGGRARVEEVLSRIEATHGGRPKRASLWETVRRAGARLRGDWIELEAEGSG